MKKIILTTSLVVLLAGCIVATTRLANAADDAWQPISRPTAISLLVSDGRDAESIATTEPDATSNAGLINAVQNAVQEMFIKKGYHLVAAVTEDSASSTRSANARVTVTVKTLRTDVQKKLLRSGEQSSAVFTVQATKGAATLSKKYEVGAEKTKFRKPFASTGKLDKKLRSILQQMLVYIAGDQEMQQFLVGE